ncbi:hypothetical protein DSO57_1028767 [Entomophthora muscae]|uniref:Uncharacterized protein n=1 Tax=Entomophthora muscae TaxID=34485 RepID=A0ACC2SE06_9FUNG|nr:hypothetical protein DSO57_1028767 [Entomophthora muscae]
MPTSNQISTIAKKRSHSYNSKTTFITPTDKIDEPAPTLANLLKTLNKSEMGITPMAEKFPILHFRGPVVIVTVDSIMLGIVRPSKKAQKARKPVLKLTELADLNQTVDQK